MSLISFCHYVIYRTSLRRAERALSQLGGTVRRHAWMPMRSKLAKGMRAVYLQVTPRNRLEGEFRCQLKQQSAVVPLVELY